MDNSNFCMTNAEANPTKSSLQIVILVSKYTYVLQDQVALKPFTISAFWDYKNKAMGIQIELLIAAADIALALLLAVSLPTQEEPT